MIVFKFVFLALAVDKTVEKWRFSEVDYSSAYNDFGGLHNALNYLNNYAFATLKDDGSITAWGASWAGGTSAPSKFNAASLLLMIVFKFVFLALAVPRMLNGHRVSFLSMLMSVATYHESESRLPSLAKSSANGLDLTLSATKTASPLGCFAVADFWKEIGGMNKTEALAQLEKFFYQGLEHKGVQLPANT
jgi:hypothetical protein